MRLCSRGAGTCQGDPIRMSPSELSFTLRNDRGEIARMFSLLEGFCQTHQISEDDMFNVRLVLDEAVINGTAEPYLIYEGSAQPKVAHQ